jgi:hypothetical protein
MAVTYCVALPSSGLRIIRAPMACYDWSWMPLKRPSLQLGKNGRAI